MAPALEPPLVVRLTADLSPETVAAYRELVALNALTHELAGRPVRPWRVFIGDPLGHRTYDDIAAGKATDAALSFVGDYSRPTSALAVAETIAAYGELGGWRTVVLHRQLDAGLVVEPADVDDLGAPRGVAYRPYGPEHEALLATLFVPTEAPA